MIRKTGKLITLIAVLVLLSTLVGCGDEGDNVIGSGNAARGSVIIDMISSYIP